MWLTGLPGFVRPKKWVFIRSFLWQRVSIWTRWGNTQTCILHKIPFCFEKKGESSVRRRMFARTSKMQDKSDLANLKKKCMYCLKKLYCLWNPHVFAHGDRFRNRGKKSQTGMAEAASKFNLQINEMARTLTRKLVRHLGISHYFFFHS